MKTVFVAITLTNVFEATVNIMSSTLRDAFGASLKSIGTACTMAAVGIYLHRVGIIQQEGKRTLALISQQVTVPLYLFTKILFCPQDNSDKPCPDVTKSLGDVWILLFWPLYVVGTGLTVGWLVAKLTKTRKSQVRAVMAACGFGNSTGLPIALLSVVHDNLSPNSDLGRMDPSLFLSVYLILYPALQWGIGDWLLTPNSVDEEKSTTIPKSVDEEKCPTTADNGLTSGRRRGHIGSSDECVNVAEHDEQNELENCCMEGDKCLQLQESHRMENGDANSCRLQQSNRSIPWSTEEGNISEFTRFLYEDGSIQGRQVQYDLQTMYSTLRKIYDRCLQPPVIASILAIIAAITPIRGLFVDIVHRSGRAPLQWMFDGLLNIGRMSVPLNMMILGCNLSPSDNTSPDNPLDGLFSIQTTVGILVGKMIIMPMIGIGSVVILRRYLWDSPPIIGSSLYLVAMIVFLCPTANNVMVMTELSKSDAKEGMARAIALQYAFAPLILGTTMAIAVSVATSST